MDIEPTVAAIRWGDDGAAPVGVACPACGGTGPHGRVLTLPQAGVAGSDWVLVHCDSCGSRFSPDRRAADYGPGVKGDALLPDIQFYLEQGAGLEAMLAPLSWAAPDPGRRFLEVGGGFGFVSDYVRTVLGWTAKGYDPSRLALFGRRLLGVDIELDYFDAGTSMDAPYDIVYGAEVVEHIPVPADFVATLKRGCAPGGIVLLTTPNAAFLHPDSPPGVLMPLLSPGLHVTLFSRAGLERLLRAAGFAHVAVVEDGGGLRALASDAPLPAPGGAAAAGVLYADWLRLRLATEGLDPVLETGLRFRLFKHLVNTADYAAALPQFNRLALLLRQRFDLDLLDAAVPGPACDITGLTAQQPFCLCNLYQLRAVLAANHERDWPGAGRYALAAVEVAAVTRPLLQRAQLEDAETELLSRQALLLALEALPASDPMETARLYERAAAAPERFAMDRRTLARRRFPLALHLLRSGAAAAALRVVRAAAGRDEAAGSAGAESMDPAERLEMAGPAYDSGDWGTVLALLGTGSDEDGSEAGRRADGYRSLATLRSGALPPADRLAGLALLPHPLAAPIRAAFAEFCADGRWEAARALAPAALAQLTDPAAGTTDAAVLLNAAALAAGQALDAGDPAAALVVLDAAEAAADRLPDGDTQAMLRHVLSGLALIRAGQAGRLTTAMRTALDSRPNPAAGRIRSAFVQAVAAGRIAEALELLPYSLAQLDATDATLADIDSLMTATRLALGQMLESGDAAAALAMLDTVITLVSGLGSAGSAAVCLFRQQRIVLLHALDDPAAVDRALEPETAAALTVAPTPFSGPLCQAFTARAAAGRWDEAMVLAPAAAVHSAGLPPAERASALFALGLGTERTDPVAALPWFAACRTVLAAGEAEGLAPDPGIRDELSRRLDDAE